MAKKKPKPAAKKGAAARHPKGATANGFRVVYTQQQIRKRVSEIAGQINRDYRGKTLYVVGVLENCFLFMADLVRALKIPTVCLFLKAEVRDSHSGEAPVREIMFTPKVEASGKDILLVDAILQSGLTLDHLYRYMLGRNASSVRTATLVEKTIERTVDVPTDYVGFKNKGKFLLGYGLAYQGMYRNLPYIAAPNK
jgi:hypoxanthine phosphoribosyltransferase